MKRAGAGAYVEVRRKISESGPNCVLRHVTQTSRAVVALWDRALKPAGLTGNQFHVLSYLVSAGDSNIKGLAAWLGMDATTVTRAIQPLIREELIITKTGKDARHRIVSISAKGRRIFTKALPLWEKVQVNVVNHFGTHDWNEMIADLEKMRRSLQEVNGKH